MINRLKVFVQNILPLVYDDSLSYYEVLCKVVAKINEVIEWVNTDFSEYIREQIGELLSGALYRASDKTVIISEETGDLTTGGVAENIQLGTVLHPVADNEARGAIDELEETVDALDEKIDEVAASIVTGLEGKNIVFFGDSWTVGGSASSQSLRFSSRIASKLRMVEKNFGVNAAGFCIPGNLIQTQLTTALANLSEDDIKDTLAVVICGGVNDWRHKSDYNITLTNLRSVVDEFVGNVETAFPNAKVYLGFSNTTKTGVDDTWRNWISTVQKTVRNGGNRAVVMQWLADSVNYNSNNYISDGLHLNDEGHSIWAGQIAQHILGGSADVDYYYGKVTAESGVTITPSSYLFREGHDMVLLGAAWDLAVAATDNTLVGSIPSELCPRVNVYIPAYRGNTLVGTFAITSNGNCRIIPLSGVSSIPGFYTPDIRWTLNA